MKIGIDITSVIYSGTGVATYTKQLTRNLLALAPEHKFTLFASTLRSRSKVFSYLRTIKRFSNFKAKIFSLPPLITETIWNKFRIVNIESLIGEIDVFHAWDWQQPPSKNAKIVTTIHDLTPLMFPHSHHKKTISVYKRRLHLAVKEASVIITDSKSSQADIEKLLNIPRSKIHPIYLGVSDQFIEFQNQDRKIINKQIKAVREKYHLNDNYILAVGTQEPRKNLRKTIKAFASLNKNNFTLAIAGKFGWGLKIASQPDSSAIKLLGFVDQASLPALYAGAKAFVYPSLYEGFGLPVLEAMAVGCPVVTSNKGSLKEIVDSSAVVVNPENTGSIAQGIKKALKSPSPNQNGIKHAHHFTWEQTAMQTLKVYKKIC